MIDYISKTNIKDILDHAEDDYANKIKEKAESLNNTKKNSLNIPLANVEKDLNDILYGVNSEPIDDIKSTNYVVKADYESIDPSTLVDPDEEINVGQDSQPYFSDTIRDELIDNNKDKEIDINYFSDGSDIIAQITPNLSVIDRNMESVIDNYAKPINVKPKMLANIKSKNGSINVIDDMDEEDDDISNIVINSEPAYTQEIPVISSEIAKNIYANSDQFTGNFDQVLVDFNNEKEKSLNLLKEYEKITTEINESDRVVQQLSNQYAEATQKLKDAEVRSNAIEQKIVSLLNGERSRLIAQIREKENQINAANARMQNNNGKIVDYKTKIADTVERTMELNRKIQQQEQILKTFDGDLQRALSSIEN